MSFHDIAACRADSEKMYLSTALQRRSLEDVRDVREVFRSAVNCNDVDRDATPRW